MYGWGDEFPKSAVIWIGAFTFHSFYYCFLSLLFSFNNEIVYLSFPNIEARLHFDIYDFTGEGKVDSFYLGDLLRSLDTRPTQAMIEKNGGQKKKGQKQLTFEEFLPIYSQVKKDKDVGAFEDLVEGLKVYDKAENGTMMEAELAHVMLSLGEKLTDAEAEDILKLCAGGADDEGFIKYETFVKNVMIGPYPEEQKWTSIYIISH